MPWWLWMLLGMALTILELQMPGSFFLLGFGLSAIVVGLLDGVGLGGPSWLQWLLFSILSTAVIVLLRRAFRRSTDASSARDPDGLIGTEAIVTEDVGIGGVGKAELRGTTWTVKTAGDATLVKGQRCRVVRIEGLTLWLQAP